MALKSYEELIKVDVRQYCEERDGFTYLNWAKCIELLTERCYRSVLGANP